jgi:hypothetical protein
MAMGIGWWRKGSGIYLALDIPGIDINFLAASISLRF